MKVDSCGYLDDQDRGDEPVDSGAEWRPPPSVGHVLAAFLPEVLEPVPGVADNEQPHRCGHAGRGERYEHSGDDAFDHDDPAVVRRPPRSRCRPPRSGSVAAFGRWPGAATRS